MKILYVCNEYPPGRHGGIGSYTKTIAEQMAELGNDVWVVGVYDIDKSSEEVVNGVKVIRLSRLRRFICDNNILMNVVKLWAERVWFGRVISNYVKKYGMNIVESYDYTAPIITKIKNAKLVVRLHGTNSAHNDGSGIKRSKAIYSIEKRGLKNADYLCSVSNYMAETTRSTFKCPFKMITIYNGVNLNLFYDRDIERDYNRMILVGRMHHVKGFDLLFEALNIVFEKNGELYLDVICGINEEFRNGLLEILNVAYHDRVHFIGRVNSEYLPNYLSSANFSLLPSRSEAFPITPLESMACGTPVIMNDKFSAREIVDDNVDGWLVDCYDRKAFAEKILFLFDNPEMVDVMRDKCIDKIKGSFRIEKINDDNMRFYEKIIK